jgi:hypothetical protein
MTALFGLIDTARDPQLYDLVKASPEHACMFGGPIKPPLDRNAPYIVSLTADSPMFTAWRDHGWGKSWGICCYSDLPLADVRRHLRQFLQAQLPDGEVVLFRFYDPRVWRTYLPTCQPPELALWFKGIDEYGSEAPDGKGTLRYRFDGGALSVTGPG